MVEPGEFDPEEEGVDLFERLRVATKPYEPEPVRVDLEAAEDPTEFEPEEENGFENEAEPEEFADGTEEDPISQMAPEDLADLLLLGGNLGQTKIFRALIQRKFARRLSETERRRIDELAAREADEQQTDLSPEDLALVAKLKRMEAAIAAVPLEADEIEMLKRYLVKVRWLQNAQISPELMFVLVAGQVMLPRVLSLWD